jgi:hypothetical protein
MIRFARIYFAGYRINLQQAAKKRALWSKANSNTSQCRMPFAGVPG